VFATFRQIVSGKEVMIDVREGQTVRELLWDLIERYPAFESELFDEQHNLLPHVHIFVNGKNIIHGSGLDSLLSKTDEVALIPPVGGG
jgi:molybdopterin synthase sulfur carrier subunit